MSKKGYRDGTSKIDRRCRKLSRKTYSTEIIRVKLAASETRLLVVANLLYQTCIREMRPPGLANPD
jgi:hypothetical protein